LRRSYKPDLNTGYEQLLITAGIGI